MTTSKIAMAATYTVITLDEMRTFLGRAFHVLEPQRQVMARGEVVIELPLSDKAYVSVFTSMDQNGQAAGVGADAIRIGLFRKMGGVGRPLQSGRLPIVKRTQNWRENLRERIEEQIERYDTKEVDIEAGKFVT